MFASPSAVRWTTLSLLAISLPAYSRKITLKNSCKDTIFPAYQGDTGTATLDDGSPAPQGWSAATGSSTDLNVPEKCTSRHLTFRYVLVDTAAGNSAKIWARTGGCNGNVASCKIGMCDEEAW